MVLDATGAFIFIGYIPKTDPVKGVIDLNNRGEIIVDQDLKTSVRGVFAAGDVIEKKVRQVTTAVSDGTVAALSVLEFLNNK